MRIIRYFFYDTDFLVLLCCLVVSSSLFFYSDSDEVNFVRGHVADLTYVLSYPHIWYKDLLATKEENKILASEVFQLQLLNNSLISYQYENDRLREMLEFKNTSPLSLIPANITKAAIESYQLVVIDVGRNDLIEKNLSVVDVDGLIGKTFHVGELATQVQLITDKNFRVSIRVGKSKVLGNFSPTVGKYGILQGVRKSVVIKEGDIAFTSGLSNIYPENIPVARVLSAKDQENKEFKKVVVEILADFSKLDYVYVIK